MLIPQLVSPHMQLVAQRAFVSIGRAGMYYALVTTVFFAAWLWWRSRPQRRARLQAGPVNGRQIGREMATSVVTVLIFGVVMPLLFAFGFGRHTQFYWSIAERGWPYFFLSVVLMLLIQDTWFYWTHRLMHHRRLFRWFHRTHHRSTNPNPWTTYSMAPLEAIVLSGATVLNLLLVPTTGAALVVVYWLNLIYGVYGHLGYEVYPRWLARHWLGRWINTSAAHNVHHARGRYNYGYYFLFWDRLMGTLDPDYEAAFDPRTGAAQP
jgi:sterol desaturase/sphingolipid hydroxylase (fatty acid hydroxylase superfamily)